MRGDGPQAEALNGRDQSGTVVLDLHRLGRTRQTRQANSGNGNAPSHTSLPSANSRTGPLMLKAASANVTVSGTVGCAGLSR